MGVLNKSEIAAGGGAVAENWPRNFATLNLGLFGDSLTNNGYYATDPVSGATYNNPDGTYPNYFLDGGNNRTLTQGWSTWLSPLSLGRIKVVKSWARKTNGLLAVGDSPVGFPLSVQVTQALADPSWSRIDRAVWMGSVNDAYAGASIDDCARELVAQIARIGKPVDLIAPPPNTTNANDNTGDGMKIWAWLLEWRRTLKAIADSSNGYIRFIDGYSVNATPTTTPATYIASRTMDGIHTNSAGAYFIALAYINATFPGGVGAGDLDIWPHDSFAGTSGAAGRIDQGFANPIFAAASGGTGTGVVAGSLTVANTAGGTHNGSVAASTILGSYGNMQGLALVAAAAGDGATITGASTSSGFAAAGDYVWAQALVRINAGGIFPRALELRLNGFQNPTNWQALEWQAQDATDVAFPFTASTTLLLRTPKLLVPSGAFSALIPRLLVRFAGAGSCSIDIANLQIMRKPVTRPY